MQLSTTLLALLPLTVAQSTTSTSYSTSSAASSAASPSASGRVINIDVGNGGLIFSPNSTTANVGDVLSFSFYPQNHSVAQSIYTQPCQPANEAAIFSGFMPVSAGQESSSTFNVVVNGTDPLWFYCSQARHCEVGMVFVVNENTPSNQTLAAYAAAARNAQTQSPARIQGGQLEQASNSTSSPTSSANGTAGATSASGTVAATGSSSTTASASASPTSGAASQYIGWGTVGFAGIASFFLSAWL